MQLAFYVAVFALTLGFLAVVFILGAQNKTLPKQAKLGFDIIGFMIVVLFVCEFGAYQLNGQTGPAVFFQYALKIGEMVIGVLLGYVAAAGIFRWTKKTLVIAAAPMVILIVLLILSTCTRIGIFYVDEGGTFHQGPAFFVYLIFIFTYMLAFFLASIYQSKTYQFRNLLSLIAIFVFMGSGVLSEVIWPEVKVNCLALAMSLLLYYNYYADLYLQGDALTKLLNRRHLDNIHLWRNKSYLIVFLDVDDFKLVNDQHGHDYGDYVLKTIGKLILDDFAKFGLCYRYGGDEFVLVLHDDEAEFLKQIQVMDRQIKDLRKADPRFPFVSYGYATCSEKGDFLKAQKEADDQMYECKKRHKELLEKQ